MELADFLFVPVHDYSEFVTLMKYISGYFYHPHPVTTTFTNKAAGNICENPYWIVFTSNYNIYVYVCVCVCVEN